MELNDSDRNYHLLYYELLFLKTGRDISDVRSLGWGRKEDQDRRFEALAGISQLEGTRILDVGCGLGDFYGFLSSRYRSFEYLGIDIAAPFISGAKINFPRGNFEQREIYDIPYSSFDYAFASGVFSLHIEDYLAKYFGIIRKMYDIVDIGIAFNMLNYGVQGRKGSLISYIPETVERICRGLITQNIQIVEGYTENDFTVYLRH